MKRRGERREPRTQRLKRRRQQQNKQQGEQQVTMTAQTAATGSGRQSHGTPSAGGTGFCRVTVVAPDSRVDVALPEDIPVADLYPEEESVN